MSTMPPHAAGARDFTIGAVFSRTFAAIASNPGTFLGITFLLGALPSVLISYLQTPAGLNLTESVQRSGGSAAAVGLQLITFIIGLFLSMLVQGALVRASLAHAEGRRASIGETIGTGARAAVPLFGLALLIALAVGAGCLLLLVPGIILWLMWSVAAPALVAERLGIGESLGRSRALTKGVRWRLFGLSLLILIVLTLISSAYGLLMVASFGVAELADATRAGLPIGWLIAQLVLSVLVTLFWSTMQNSLYIELKSFKDGTSPDQLAEIFA